MYKSILIKFFFRNNLNLVHFYLSNNKNILYEKLKKITNDCTFCNPTTIL